MFTDSVPARLAESGIGLHGRYESSGMAIAFPDWVRSDRLDPVIDL
ncbi:hypothetical protein [Phormidium sp. CCY1219]|nr:hypothetical protein [Phormidium sp. CCY1219]MEB3829153.1 hypothetical protein [Phormidium sp. CCY1219]